MSPLASAIVPTYNNAQYIIETINSAINQTINDLEIIVVDDCSTDNTEELLSPYVKQYPFLRYCRLKTNCGPAVARTEAIKQARGKYCAFLDADDLWDSNKLERQIGYMEENNICFSCTGYRLMDQNGILLNKTLLPPHKINYNLCVKLGNPIGNLTAVYNQELLGKYIIPNIKKRNDFALWLQILKDTDFCYGMNEVLATYRHGRNGSVSSNKVKLLKYHWQLYHDIEKHSTFKSLYELFFWGVVKTFGIHSN